MALIPVNSLKGFHPFADGYFFDTETGHLLSNKKDGSFAILSGSVRNGNRRYNLQLKREYKTIFQAKSGYVKHDDLAKKANEVSKRLSFVETPNKLVEAAKAKAKAQAQGQKKGWVIGFIQDDYIKLDIFPKVYETEAEVNAEIEQQTLSNVGTTFVKLKVESFAVSGGVQWS